MSLKMKILAGAAGLAAVVCFAIPAAAHYYPKPGYGYANNQGGVLGPILNGVCRRTASIPTATMDTVSMSTSAAGSTSVRAPRKLTYRWRLWRLRRWRRLRWRRLWQPLLWRRPGSGHHPVERKSYGLKVFGVASLGYGAYDGYNR